MAVPQRRTSKMRKRTRRSHQALSIPGTTVCSNCGEVVLAHRVCKVCGFYAGKEVVKVEEIKISEA